MKRKVPKKNISYRIADIRHPERELDTHSKQQIETENFVDEAAAEFFESAENKPAGVIKPPPIRKKTAFRRILFLSAFFALVVLLLWGAGAYAKLDNLLGYFSSTNGEISRFLNENNYAPAAGATSGTKLSIFDIAKNKDVWSNISSLYSGFENFSVGGIGAVQELELLNGKLPEFLLRGGGEELISHLTNLKNYLEMMNEANGKLNSLNIGLEKFFSGEYGSPLSLDLNFRRADNFLGALINWLSSGAERHLLVLLENSSELRPGGGFIGSYADVTFSGGSVKTVDVHDINDVDRLLAANIVPPKPLQAIEKGWLIADSNWFFDYPLSARKIIELMEESKMYSGKISFDGAIAVSPAVIGNILEITGPVKLSARGIVVNKDNFLEQIQNDVQEAQAKGTPPKKIIAELVPELLSRAGEFKESDSRLLVGKIFNWIRTKDLTFYFQDADMQNFLDFYGASGKIFESPADFNGDYLAVASANIGGGKSDFVLKQVISFKTQINLDGTADDHLEISRQHLAGKNAPWWYRVPNESYLQIFVPRDALLSTFSGGWNRKIYPKVDYEKSGYRTDALVASVESTLKKNFSYPSVDEFQESGKKVFAVWDKTSPGQTTKTIFDYSVHLFSTPADKQKYQFVFEKQSGSDTDIHLEIYAPVGFVWVESNSPVFEYQAATLNGTVVTTLTMKKIEL